MAELDLNGQLSKIVEELVRQGVTLEQGRGEFERQFIIASLTSNAGNLGRSAEQLGIHRNTLRNKVSGHKICAADLKRSSSTSGKR